MPLNIPPAILKEIAGHLDSGMKCFYHITTGELESYPDDLEGQGGFDTEDWQKIIDKGEDNFHDYIYFEPMDGDESFRVMAAFIASIENNNIRQKFDAAISYKKPFQNFKYLLNDHSALRELWFIYKDEAHLDHVREQLEIYNRRRTHEIDGVE